MAVIRITKQFSFEMAHALMHYDGLCKNIHGHSYRMDVTVQGTPETDQESPKNGMIMDFRDLKRMINRVIIDVVDHALLLCENSSPELVHQLRLNYNKILLVTYQPTTENLLSDFAEKIQSNLPPHIQLFSIRLRETDSSFAEWFAADNQ